MAAIMKILNQIGELRRMSEDDSETDMISKIPEAADRVFDIETGLLLRRLVAENYRSLNLVSQI